MRQLMEQIDYNLLFRWFVGLGIDDAVWDHSTFSKNRDRLLDADVAAKLLEAVLRHPKVKRFLSDDHFSVDGTLVEEAFGWGKSVVGLAKAKVRGLERVRFKFTFAMAAFNLIRMPRLLAAA